MNKYNPTSFTASINTKLSLYDFEKYLFWDLVSPGLISTYHSVCEHNPKKEDILMFTTLMTGRLTVLQDPTIVIHALCKSQDTLRLKCTSEHRKTYQELSIDLWEHAIEIGDVVREYILSLSRETPNKNTALLLLHDHYWNMLNTTGDSSVIMELRKKNASKICSMAEGVNSVRMRNIVEYPKHRYLTLSDWASILYKTNPKLDIEKHVMQNKS